MEQSSKVGHVHRCKGQVEVNVVLVFDAEGQFNGNYRSGIEELEDCAVEQLMNDLPNGYRLLDVKDVKVTDYELIEEQKEVERED